MSTARPNFIDLRSESQTSTTRPTMRSPRLHVAGEVPPEFSPLDAFAMQSRLLAMQLKEESNKAGKRMSRLPPLTTESPLIVQGRSDYFRSMSYDSTSDHSESPLQNSAGLGLVTEVNTFDADRPLSMHPRMSRIPPTPDLSTMPPLPTSPTGETLRGRQQSTSNEQANSYFGARRELSPPPLDRGPASLSTGRPDSRSTTADSLLAYPSTPQNYTLSGSPVQPVKDKTSFDLSGLVPPPSLFPRRSSSIMSSPLESTDADSINEMSASFHSQPARKTSHSSGMISPPFGSRHHRLGSAGSDASGLSLPRPSFNFSRPISRASNLGLETPLRQGSSDSQTSFILADDAAHTPVSMNSEVFPDPHADDAKSAAPSYTYSKFSLPRGKALQRSSTIYPDHQQQESFPIQDHSLLPSNSIPTFPMIGQPPPSPPTRPTSSDGPGSRSRSRFLDQNIPRPSLECATMNIEVLRAGQQPSPSPSRPSTDDGRTSDEGPRGRALISPRHDEVRGKTPMSTTTSDSASTVKPGAARSQFSAATSSASDMTAEEHVTKAIALHEEGGSLNESTYHLRHAARQGHPTGMLLYALACRHGWGMRPNPAEGVRWLRKAAESAGLEMTDEEPAVNVTESKTRKAQFALSIYELGVSHMNGWGIEQDKALALRCFEIAGSWGDVDALAEAGFCYAQGIGCKKNLKKSAGFYRQAEARGMSMVGNSWIHKSKYNDDAASYSSKKSSKSEKKKEEKEAKSRSKSRTRRNIFGLKLSSS